MVKHQSSGALTVAAYFAYAAFVLDTLDLQREATTVHVTSTALFCCVPFFVAQIIRVLSVADFAL